MNKAKRRQRETGRDADPTLAKLDEIHVTLKHLLILAGRRAGLKKEQVREIVKMDSRVVSRVWKLLPRGKDKDGSEEA